MDRKWLTGFIEGSGCFSIIIRKSQTKVGYQTIADFTLKRPLDQLPLLEEIKSFLKIGRVYENKKEAIFKINKIDDAKRLITFFKNNALVSPMKQKEFTTWKDCVDIMDSGLQHTAQGILEIAHMRDGIHTRNLWNKKNYCNLRRELDPCQVYEEQHVLPEGCRICWTPSLVQLPMRGGHA